MLTTGTTLCFVLLLLGFFGFDSATKLTLLTADIERCYDMQSALEIRGVSWGIII